MGFATFRAPARSVLFSLILICAFSATAFGSGFLFYRSYFRPAGHLHTEVRERAIVSQADQLGSAQLVIVGDSIVELGYFDTLCPDRVLNAGVGGFRVADTARLVAKLTDKIDARVFAIAAGVNDAQRSEPRNIKKWLSDYEAILAGLSGKRIVIIGVAPVEAGMPIGDKYFDPAFIDAENAGLAVLAARYHADFVAPPQSMAGKTVDGVHFRPEAYADLIGRIRSSGACN